MLSICPVLPFSVLVPGLLGGRVFCSHPCPMPVTNPVSPAATEAGLPGRALSAVPGLLPPCSQVQWCDCREPHPWSKGAGGCGQLD